MAGLLDYFNSERAPYAWGLLTDPSQVNALDQAAFPNNVGVMPGNAAMPVYYPHALPTVVAEPVHRPAPPLSVSYPSPLTGKMDSATGQAPDASDAAAYGSMGVDPSTLSLPTPPVSPFPQQPQQQAASVPDLGNFGKDAVPFGFAGPGSLSATPSVLGPAAPAAPVPAAAPAPAVAQAPAAAPTDTSSINRPSPDAMQPDSVVNVGNYKMPMFGEAPDNEPAAKPTPAPAAAVPASAPFSLGGAGDRLGLSTRGFFGNLHNGPIAALAGGLGSLITGKESDPSAIAREKVNASAQALVSKGASPAEAAAAVNNPTLMSALIQQYYGKDKWSVVKTGKDADGNEIYMQQNQVDGTLRPLPAGATPAASGAGSTVTGPDGKPIVVPAGVDRKTFIKRVSETSADAATGKKTEAQAKASSFAARMQQAEGDISKFQNEGLSGTQAITSSIPGVGNYLQTTDHQKFETAKSAFITALLRQESGAAINKSEFSRYEKELFPQPGDAPGVVQQKAALRSAAIEQMKGAAGPGYQPPAAPAVAKPSGSVNVGGQAIKWSVN